MKGAQTSDAQLPESIVEQGPEQKEKRHTKQAQAVNQGVNHVGADGGTVRHCLNRSPTLQTTTVKFAEAGIAVSNASRVGVHSAWGEAGSRHPEQGGSYTLEVPARGAALLVIEPEI